MCTWGYSSLSNGPSINTVATVSETLPMAALLGMDVPELTSLLSRVRSEQTGAFVTTMHGRARRHTEEEVSTARKQELSACR